MPFRETYLLYRWVNKLDFVPETAYLPRLFTIQKSLKRKSGINLVIASAYEIYRNLGDAWRINSQLWLTKTSCWNIAHSSFFKDLQLLFRAAQHYPPQKLYIHCPTLKVPHFLLFALQGVLHSESTTSLQFHFCFGTWIAYSQTQILASPLTYVPGKIPQVTYQ